MFTFNSGIFDFDIQNDNTYLYLFKSEWRKKFMDTGSHNYGGFKSLLKTESGKVINTGNYSIQDTALAALDPQLTSLLGTFVESHYISILPECNVGEHYDIYDPEDETVNVTDNDFINTSILYPVYGDIVVESDGHTRILQPDVFTVIDTSKLHNGTNFSKNVVWCSSSLVYGKSYNDIKRILREYIVDDYDEIGE
jgi:hypothetical protein